MAFLLPIITLTGTIGCIFSTLSGIYIAKRKVSRALAFGPAIIGTICVALLIARTTATHFLKQKGCQVGSNRLSCPAVDLGLEAKIWLNSSITLQFGWLLFAVIGTIALLISSYALSQKNADETKEA